MASEYETVAKVIDDFAYLITLGNIRPAVATNIKSRIESAHKRKVAELERKAREANLKYRAEKSRHTDTYKDARIKAQDEEIATLKREVDELRRRLKVAEDALGESKVAVCHTCDLKSECFYGTDKFEPCCIVKDIDDALAAIRE